MGYLLFFSTVLGFNFFSKVPECSYKRKHILIIDTSRFQVFVLAAAFSVGFNDIFFWHFLTVMYCLTSNNKCFWVYTPFFNFISFIQSMLNRVDASAAAEVDILEPTTESLAAAINSSFRDFCAISPSKWLFHWWNTCLKYWNIIVLSFFRPNTNISMADQ